MRKSNQWHGLVAAVCACCVSCTNRQESSTTESRTPVRIEVGIDHHGQLVEYVITDQEELDRVAAYIPTSEQRSAEPEPLEIVRDAYLRIRYRGGGREELTISDTLGVIFDQEDRTAKVSPELTRYLRERVSQLGREPVSEIRE